MNGKGAANSKMTELSASVRASTNAGQRIMSGLQFTSRSFVARVNIIEHLLKHELLKRLQTFIGAPQCFAQVSSSILPIEFSAHSAVGDSKALVGASGENFILNAGEKFPIMFAAKTMKNGRVLDANPLHG